MQGGAPLIFRVSHTFFGHRSMTFAAALVVVSCGGPGTDPSAASGTAVQASSSEVSGARLVSPVPLLPSPAPGYKAYISSTSRYSFEYPATWFEYPELKDGSNAGKDFMSQNIASPVQLDATGIWLSIIVNTAPGSCSLGSDAGGTKVTSLEVSIDGVSSTAMGRPGR